MEQREQYLESSEYWNSNLTRKERLSRWWRRPEYGLALSGKAARAVGAAEQAMKAAEDARELVYRQAVFALLEEGETVREIAAKLHLSRSAVGRMAKDVKQGWSFPLQPSSVEYKVRELVLEAWAFKDLESSLRDHPRGTLEAASDHEHSAVAGTGGAPRV